LKRAPGPERSSSFGIDPPMRRAAIAAQRPGRRPAPSLGRLQRALDRRGRKRSKKFGERS